MRIMPQIWLHGSTRQTACLIPAKPNPSSLGHGSTTKQPPLRAVRVRSAGMPAGPGVADLGRVRGVVARIRVVRSIRARIAGGFAGGADEEGLRIAQRHQRPWLHPLGDEIEFGVERRRSGLLNPIAVDDSLAIAPCYRPIESGAGGVAPECVPQDVVLCRGDRA